MYGRTTTVAIQGGKLPAIKTFPAWDGKDGQLPEDEDIDLSDVDLDDKVELQSNKMYSQPYFVTKTLSYAYGFIYFFEFAIKNKNWIKKSSAGMIWT